MKHLGLSIVLSLMALTATAQKMEFSFTGLSGVKTKYLHDGTTLVQLPARTSLSNLSSYGMTATADGTAATLSDIVPNPGSTTFTDGALNVFYYNGKAYKVRFAAGEYFTAVFFSNAKLGGTGMTKSNLTDIAQRITTMGTSNGPNYEFDNLPGYTATTDIAFFLGDMNASTSSIPVIHTLDDNYMNIVAKCAVVTGQFEAYGTAATVTEYGLCYSTSADPTINDTYKAAADIADEDDTFDDDLKGIFGVYFDNLTAETTYHVRAYCKYTTSGSATVNVTYGEDRTITTPKVSGFTWGWEGGETPSDTVKTRIEDAMNGASEYYNNYCTLYKWCGTSYNSGVATADCSLRSDGSCYIRFGPNERYQWVGTAQHEISHGYGVGQTSAYAGYANPFNFKVATLTLRVFLQDMTMLISHDSQHYWPGGINQREEVTTGTSNNKGTYTCKDEEMLKCNAMILNGLAKDGMQTTYGAKSRDGFTTGCMTGNIDEDLWAPSRSANHAPRRVSQSSDASASDFEDALDAFNQASIPLILAPGDIDLATTLDATGKTLNTNTFAAMTRALTEAQTHGIENLNRFTNGQTASTYVQAQPFTFTFKDVRFYNGQYSWFDEAMYNSSNTYRWIYPDQVYSNLQTFVNSDNHPSETSIWMQHLPMNASDSEWYPSKTTYQTGTSRNSSSGSYNTAAKRRTALNTLIKSTANAAMFSGHASSYNDNYYNNEFHDYTVADMNSTPGDALIVLMKAGTGVIEVKQVDFRAYDSFAQQYEDPATELTAGEDNAVLAGLVQGITNLNTTDTNLNSAVSTGQNANTATAVKSAISSINSAFTSYVTSKSGNIDVSKLLGSNLDFSEAIGTQNSQRQNVYEIPGWNTYMNAASSTWQFIQYKNDLDSPNGGNALYIRENWKGNPALASKLQVYRDAVLPSGTYRLSFELRQPNTNQQESLNYYELNGLRTTFSAGSSWETKSFQFTVTNPVTFRLSFGFVGTTTEGNLPSEVDVDNVKLILVQREQTEGKASMAADGWTQLTALPSDYSPYFFAIYDHTQDLGMVQEAGVNQGSSYKAMWYAANVTPGLDKTALWTFDSNVDGSTEYVVMANASYPDYMMQTEWNNAWFFRTHDNGGGGISWGRTLVSYADSKWTVQNGKYPDDGYLGPWADTVEDGAETALNKSGSAIGYFDIYSMLRGQYVATYEPISTASETNSINITYVLENPGGERRSTIGWKTDGADWWGQSSAALGGKVGTYFLESWAQSGLAATDLYQTISGLPDGRYKFSAIANCTSNCNMYANDQSAAIPTNNPGTRTEVITTLSGIANGGSNTLRIGFKTGTSPGSWIAFDDAQLEYLGVPETYNIGVPTTSIANGDYIQSLTTVTYNFTEAYAPGGTATITLLSSSARATLTKSGSTVAQGTLSVSGNIVTATFPSLTLDTSSDYTLTLPADVVGYSGHATNEAVTLTLHTPALFDTTCYLYNESEYKYLSRNGEWNTQAVADDYGLAVQIVTNEEGNTHLRMFDNQRYVYADNSGKIFADGETPMNLTTVAVSAGKYRFQTDSNYLGISNGVIATSGTANGSNLWTLQTPADHVANYTTLANAQAATAATAASLSGVTTAAQMEGKIGTDLYAEELSVTGEKDEKFKQYAPTAQDGSDLDYYTETLTGLTPGLYRVSVDAFQRATYNADVAAAGGARGLIMLFANDAQTQLKSVMEYGAANAYADDYEYNGSHYPNNMTSGYAALATGNYENVAYVYVPAAASATTGTLTFGIRILNRMGNEVERGTWCIYDNFKVEYLMPVVNLDETAATAPAAANNVCVNFRRSIVANTNVESGNAWNTICFPFNMDEDLIKEAFGENTVVKELDYVETSDDNVILYFSAVDSIVANTPYIMQTDQARSVFQFPGIDVRPSENLTVTKDGVQFIGTYTYETENPVMSNTNGDDYYILNDVFKHSTGRTKIKGYRAYFHVPSGGSVKALSFGTVDTGEATSISSIDGILSGPVDIYTPSGQLVRRQATSHDDLPRGLYIVGGKKLFVK